MRFSLQVGMCDPTHYPPMAKAAEEAGFDGLATGLDGVLVDLGDTACDVRLFTGRPGALINP